MRDARVSSIDPSQRVRVSKYFDRACVTLPVNYHRNLYCLSLSLSLSISLFLWALGETVLNCIIFGARVGCPYDLDRYSKLYHARIEDRLKTFDDERVSSMYGHPIQLVTRNATK